MKLRSQLVMKKFNTVIKVKENELLNIQKLLHSKDVELTQITKITQQTESEIKTLIAEINSNVYSNSLEFYSLIDKLKDEWKDMENKKQSILKEKNAIFSKLLIKKQEIKSIEMLLAKKVDELKKEELKKEQNLLDELNSLE